jgi:PadR family transcriptional regulator PadR
MAGDNSISQMKKGALEYCVLALLVKEPRYGFDLVRRLSEIDGLLTTEGTIYPLLTRLRRDELVDSEWRESSEGPPRRYYRLTTQGRGALAGFRQQWATFRVAVDRLLEAGGTA